jgi:hypothetical protein
LNKGQYASAYLYSERLKSLSIIKHGFISYWAHYEDEIYECMLICAENGETRSMISLMEKYTEQQDCIDPRAYFWCNKLYKMGYIPSIRWLAECYEKGIGCEVKIGMAFHLYFEGMILESNEFCRMKFIEHFHKYNKNEYLDALMNKNLFYGNIQIVRGKIGCLIMEKKLLCWPSLSPAYPVLRGSYVEDGVALSHLAECLLYGIGTSINVPAAYHILFKADWFLENDMDDIGVCQNEEDYNKFAIGHIYEIDDYRKAYAKTKKMIDEAEKILISCTNTKNVYNMSPDNSEIIKSYVDENDEYIDTELIEEDLVRLWENAPVKYFKA